MRDYWRLYVKQGNKKPAYKENTIKPISGTTGAFAEKELLQKKQNDNIKE